MTDTLRWWLVALLPPVIASWIWELSEWSGIGLRSWAPYIFGQAMGGKRPQERKES